MKNWDKGKKDSRRNDERDFQSENQKKKKLKPIEKTKYRLKDHFQGEDDY